ncbi:hypothetical protein Psta_1913 [Pirellula staleyi DSM 6068]|uniref:Uncharacterized protein n=1 Tax=Pirellula staleyi (strain ATCC 27377 / DSM 6068 / ICPB 4128) TaxID=530564 RepID=D2QZV4_PIRSD|nr:hypothetical protein Psta_1913 [Pirellula staleyi DSM 6068]
MSMAYAVRSISLMTLVLATVGGSISLTGCGGGGSGEASLNDQYTAALKISDAGVKSRKLAQLAPKQKEAGDIMGADASIASASEAARSIADPVSKANTLVTVAAAAGKLEMSSDKIKELLKEAAATSKEIPDADARIPVLAEVATNTKLYLKNVDAAAEYLRNAEEAAESLPAPLTRAVADAKIGASYCKIERSDDANRVFEASLAKVRGSADQREKSDCLCELAAGMAIAGMSELAAGVFSEAEQAASAIESAESKAYAYLRLAQKTKTAKLTAESGKHLAQAEKLAEQVKDSSVRTPLTEAIEALKK